MSELAGVIERVRGLVKDEPEVLAYHSIGSVELLSLCAAAERGAQLEAELAVARADAERFRWMEENGVGIEHGCAVSLVVPVGRTSGGEMLTTSVHEENLRDAVDAARKLQP